MTPQAKFRLADGHLPDHQPVTREVEALRWLDENPFASITAIVTQSLTPMQQRYFERKAQLPAGMVVVMRLGDFYEVFGDDVPRVCKTLNIVQTKRGSIAMCGFPYHAAHKYIGQLEQAGITVETMEHEVQP